MVIYANTNFQAVLVSRPQTLNTFQKLDNYGVDIKDHNSFFDHFFVYDFETILSQTEIKNPWDVVA